MSYTLKHLLENYKVMIPQIQRDYAQGRESEFELRKGFVGKIKQTLSEDGELLNLDFIYGYTEKAGGPREIFIPLDGQQRLTTLWLTHWWLAPRTEDGIMKDINEYLSQFTYETRMSSKRFCHALINQPLAVDKNLLISEQIIDAPWFMASWSNDPTVAAMLNTLDTLQEEFRDMTEAWENLTKNNQITFDFIDIKSDEFKLTDELYIKMNSRGKPLTHFENFKAQFSGLLASKKTDYEKLTRKYRDTKISYQQYFAFKIDSQWMDLFWNYRKITSKQIDRSIDRFINFIAEFLFFRENPDAVSADVKMDFDFLNNVFSKRENIDFLFNSLDFLSSLDDVKIFFDELFNHVSTFDPYTKDYFLRAITDTGFDVKDKTILYAILAACTKWKIYTVNDEIRDFIRIVRNLLLNVRQPSQSKRIDYTTNLRLPNVSEYCKFIDSFVEDKITKDKSVYEILFDSNFTGFASQNILNEKNKASVIIHTPDLKLKLFKLEEHSDLQGNLSAFKLDSNDFSDKIDAFLSVWSPEVSNSMIIRALLSIGDYSVQTHEYSSLGEIYFFGCKGSWNRILTTGDKDERISVSSVLDKFLVAFCQAEGDNTSKKLQAIIDSFIEEERGWLYYFVKYQFITDNSFRSQNVFSWSGQGFDINHLGNSGKQPLHSYHLNPYLIVLRLMFKGNDKLTMYWGRFTDLSHIQVENKITIRCTQKGWTVRPFTDFIIEETLIDNFGLVEQNNSYGLQETAERDRIEIAFDFVNVILNSQQRELL